MSIKVEARIVIAWWNTSLSPQGKSRASEKDRQIASQVIGLLVNDLGVDCLAVGEVTSDDLHYIVEYCSLKNFAILDGTLKKGRLKWDTGLIYNKHQIELLDSKYVESSYAQQSLKIAHRMDIRICETNEPLHLFILHWPSRLWSPANEARRDNLGDRLRREINELKRDCLYSPQIIIAGDFNDEPFDQPLAGHLLATRDRTLARENDDFFYNPFWRHLGETLPYIPGNTLGSIGGTYFHKTGNVTKWRTFDQIIVSSSFLNHDRWYLNEEHTAIFQHPSYDELVRDSKEIFDHFPVFSVIQRRLDLVPKGGKL